MSAGCVGIPDWSGMRHDAGIEQRRRFERIFVQEVAPISWRCTRKVVCASSASSISRRAAQMSSAGCRCRPLEILQHIGQLAAAACGSR